MTVSPYFFHSTCDNRQELQANLVNEMIRAFGVDIRYMPHTSIYEDSLFGDSPLSTFNDAVQMEMYVKNIDGFEGVDIISPFGLQIQKSITFVVSRSRFTTILNRFNISLDRPYEGDLIYIPMTKKLVEIKFVEHEVPFYQFGTLYQWEMYCEVFPISQDVMNTGNTIIDAIGTRHDIDLLTSTLSSEDGNSLVYESNTSVINEQRIESTQPTANNELMRVNEAEYVDWSEINPFLR